MKFYFIWKITNNPNQACYSLGSFVKLCAKSVTSKIMTESQKTNNKRHFRGVCHFFPPIWSSFLPILPPGEMKIKCLDILMICISFERVFRAVSYDPT